MIIVESSPSFSSTTAAMSSPSNCESLFSFSQTSPSTPPPPASKVPSSTACRCLFGRVTDTDRSELSSILEDDKLRFSQKYGLDISTEPIKPLQSATSHFAWRMELSSMVPSFYTSTTRSSFKSSIDEQGRRSFREHSEPSQHRSTKSSQVVDRQTQSQLSQAKLTSFFRKTIRSAASKSPPSKISKKNHPAKIIKAFKPSKSARSSMIASPHC